MPQLFIDNVATEIGGQPETWGDLLEKIDNQVADHGLMLAAARFDGVDEPSFRDAAVTTRRLANVHRLDVATATPAHFLRQCLREAIVPLEQAADATLALCARYRTLELAGCHEGLTALAENLRGLLSLIATLDAMHVDLDSHATDGLMMAERIARLGVALDAVVAAQESADWLTAADVLEYDLEPAIRQWIAVLSAVADAQ